MSEKEKPATDKGTEDYLGYGVYADTLWARIETALNKDADGNKALGDDPLVVGLFGEWGAGKSKLLSLVQDRAKLHSQSQIAERMVSGTNGLPMTVTVPVYFQPWKYEHEPHLHVPFAIHVSDALRDTWKLLPTDIEKLKVWAHTQGDKAGEIGEKIEVMKGAIEKAQGFWSGARDVLKSKTAAVVAGTVDAVAMTAGVPPIFSAMRKKIINGVSVEIEESDDGETDDGEPGDETNEAKSSSSTNSADQKKKQAPESAWRHTDDGLGFYRIHKNIKALTRPKLNKKMLETAGINVTPGIEFDLRINFVIFIDDLDRCLPEKAVETLELIKTVFNLESFAFVLALDEEVVERGIGHRYKDYALAGKKPEMPITGFEYLEKIVHLPFRLPALRPDQGRMFLQRYENGLLQARAGALFPSDDSQAQRNAWIKDRTWFSSRAIARDGRHRMGGAESSTMAGEGGDPTQSKKAPDTLNLDQLVIRSFTAFVPRKLIRVVELFHQVIDVLEKDEKFAPLAIGAAGEKVIDPRMVLALLLLQLFQPELYRALRRTGTGFEALLSGFAPPASPSARQLNDFTSDADLLHWALEWQGETPPTTVRAAHQRISAVPYGNRYAVQRILLPIAERIIEHRAAQRHVFDPLRLFFEIYSSAKDLALPAMASRDLFSFLAQASEDEALAAVPLIVKAPEPTPVPPPGAASPAADWRSRKRVDAIEKVYVALVSSVEAEQKRAAEYAELSLSEAFDAESAKALHLRITQGLDANDSAGVDRVLSGLKYLAPYFVGDEAKAIWEMVKAAEPQGESEFGSEITSPEILKRRELWADVRSSLGQDPRFAAPLWLPKEKYNGNSDDNEPITGFVRLRSSTTSKHVTTQHDFFLARTLTTVDQYAAFVSDGGYTTDKWWDLSGLDWKKGDDSKIKDSDYRKHLASRTKEMRIQPMDWAEQRPHGARAVQGVNWYEARAYARWLDAKLENTIKSALTIPSAQKFWEDRYHVMLPTEAQWERARCAADWDHADGRKYPWGEVAKEVHLAANISGSGINWASVVGLFPPNPLGASDLAGNLWEWQNGVYEKRGSYDVGDAIPKIKSKTDFLVSGKDFGSSDCPALRGGSWYDNSGNARASIRGRNLPDYWGFNIGFRVVMSLAKNEP